MGEKEGKSLVASFSFAPYDGIWFCCCFVFFLYIDSSLNMRSNCGAEAHRHGGSPRTEAGWFCLQTGRAKTLPLKQCFVQDVLNLLFGNTSFVAFAWEEP